MKYSLSELAEIVKGKFIGCDRTCERICYDSRTLYSSDSALFIALEGQCHSGLEHIADCYNRGVMAFMVSTDFADFDRYPQSGFVVVDNTLDALQKLAAYHRSKIAGKVVAVVGSNGKSSVKELASQLFNGGGKLFRSPKSYNSQLGVALSLLMSSGDEDLVIIEAGISEQGEMSRLAAMIEPNIVLLTNIGDAHSENFDDNSQKLQEKLSIAEGCETIIYRAYSWESNYIESHFSNSNLVAWSESEFNFEIPFDDRVSRENTFAALMLLKVAGFYPDDIESSLKSLQRISMRLELREGCGGSQIINDSYNSDLGSIGEALNYMQSLSGDGKRRVVVLSDVLQSGISDDILYPKVAAMLRELDVELFIAIGDRLLSQKEHFSGMECRFFTTTDRALEQLCVEEFKSSLILLKGCRKFALERLLTLLEERHHNTILEINIDNMLYNLDYYRKMISKECRLMAMVKADGYGCGAVEIARALERSHVDYLAVAYADEGVELRRAGVHLPIVVLGSDPFSHRAMIENHLEPEIYSIDVLQNFISECRSMAVTNYPIHIKIDSGMNRVGFKEDQIDALLSLLSSQHYVEVRSIFSHLSSSDIVEEDQFTHSQIDYFDRLSSKISDSVRVKPLRHICNSAAIERFGAAHFDMVRLGIGLYGYGANRDKLRGVAHLKSVVVQTKDVCEGQSVGYNRSYKTDAATRIGTIAIGYADGFRRILARKGWSVMANGKEAKVIGNICMDSAMIDISGCDISVGDYVTIFGDELPLVSMSDKLDTIEYEVLTSISKRVKRSYIKE